MNQQSDSVSDDALFFSISISDSEFESCSDSSIYYTK